MWIDIPAIMEKWLLKAFLKNKALRANMQRMKFTDLWGKCSTSKEKLFVGTRLTC